MLCKTGGHYWYFVNNCRMGNISVWIFLLLGLFVNILSTRFCSESVLETKPIKRSYLEVVKVPKKYSCCPNISCNPPICTKYETVVKKKWKVEKVTARVTRRKCCTGYRHVKGERQYLPPE